jgi:hypothetical protein
VLLVHPDLAADSGHPISKLCEFFGEAVLVFPENRKLSFSVRAVSDELKEAANRLEGHSRCSERLANLEQLDVCGGVDAMAALSARDGTGQKSFTFVEAERMDAQAGPFGDVADAQILRLLSYTTSLPATV